MDGEQYSLVILTPAQRELDTIFEVHYQLYGLESAWRITDRIHHALGRLRSFPLSGKLPADYALQKEGYRLLICGRYICVYRLIGATVYVYHIVHGATDYPKLFKTLNNES